ncbi:Gypsy retrotransposon integrase-like protein 1, partial [Marasmius sp. AFHP31]
KWDSDMADPVFLHQSATLYMTYHWVQIHVHRPFIPRPGRDPVLPFPSLAICSNAARRIVHIAEVLQDRRDSGVVPLEMIPNILSPLFTATTILLVSIWRPHQSPKHFLESEKDMSTVYRAIEIVQKYEDRYPMAGRVADTLNLVLTVGQIPRSRGSLKRSSPEDDFEYPLRSAPGQPRTANESLSSEHPRGSANFEGTSFGHSGDVASIHPYLGPQVSDFSSQGYHGAASGLEKLFDLDFLEQNSLREPTSAEGLFTDDIPLDLNLHSSSMPASGENFDFTFTSQEDWSLFMSGVDEMLSEKIRSIRNGKVSSNDASLDASDALNDSLYQRRKMGAKTPSNAANDEAPELVTGTASTKLAISLILKLNHIIHLRESEHTRHKLDWARLPSNSSFTDLILSTSDGFADGSPFFDSQRVLKLFILNSIPSPQHEAELRGYLLQLSKLSIRLRADTKDALGSSEEKEKLFRALELAMQLYRTIVSAHRKLPPEILQRIFSFCVMGPDSEVSSFKTALVLSHVSRNWRSVALSQPTLWSKVTVDVLKIAASAQTVSDVAILLERSKNIPLTIILLATRSPATGGDTTLLGQHDPHAVGNALISLLKETLSSVYFRVCSLEIHCQSDTDLGPGQRSLSLISAPPAPILERLDMPVDLTRCPFVVHWIQTLISGAPHLRYLSSRTPSIAIQSAVQWHSMETMDLLEPSNQLSCVNLSQISILLSAAPTLRVCAVGLSDQHVEYPAGVPATLTHPSLRVLTIHAHRTNRFGDFLDRFTFPSLLSLTISGIMERWPETPMKAFLARSRCPIKQLSVPDTPIAPDIIISHISTDVVRNSLEDLRLHKTSTAMVDRLLEHLTFQPNAPSYLNLHTLVCAVSPTKHTQVFSRFASSRLDSDASTQVAKLKRVHLNVPSDASQTNATLELVAFLIMEKIEASVVQYNPWDLENFNPPTPSTREYGEEDCDTAPDHDPAIQDESCLDDLELAYPDDHEMRLFDGDYQPLTTDEKTPALMETQYRLDPGVGETNEEHRLPAGYPPSTGSSTPSPERKRRRFISERARMSSELWE